MRGAPPDQKENQVDKKRGRNIVWEGDGSDQDERFSDGRKGRRKEGRKEGRKERKKEGRKERVLLFEGNFFLNDGKGNRLFLREERRKKSEGS